MTLNDLSKDEMLELKERYLTQKNKSISYDEIAFADELVSDKEIFEEYGNTIFTEEDFFCNSNNENNNYEEEI